MANELMIKVPCNIDDEIFRIIKDEVVTLRVIEIKAGVCKSRNYSPAYAVYAVDKKKNEYCNTSTFFNDTWFTDKASALTKLKKNK